MEIKMKKNTYIQVEISSKEDIERMMVILKGHDKIGPHGKVTLAYGIAESVFNRGIRFINVYDNSNEIKYSGTRNKQMPLSTINEYQNKK